MAVTENPQEQLDWEARQRPRAAIAAVVSAAATLGADLFSGAAFGDAPRAGFAASLQQAVEPGELGSATSLRVPFYEFIDDHAATLVGSGIARAVGLVALGWALTFLAAATRARRPELPRMAIPLALVGTILSAVAIAVGAFGFSAAVSDFLAGPRTVDAAQNLGTGSLVVTTQIVALAGQFAIAVGFVLVSLNAMRAGLLTRFLGILGVIVGVLTIVQIGPLQVVQPVWLLAAGLLFAGAWPGGVPPAWRTGRAEPWPTSQQIAEQRRAKAGRAQPATEPAAPAADRSATAAARRKRKRRK